MKPQWAGLAMAAVVAGSQVWAESSVTHVPSRHAQVKLVSEVGAIQPGKVFHMALRMKLDSGWHTYWVNPGDAGAPLRFKWKLPPGFAAGDILWPAPKRFEEDGIVSFGYDGEVALIVPITPPADLPVGKPAKLRARADWLVTSDMTLPEKAEFEISLPVVEAAAGNQADDPQTAVFFRHQPGVARDWDVRAIRDVGAVGLLVSPPAEFAGAFDGAEFFPEDRNLFSYSKPFASMLGGRGYAITLPVAKNAREKPARVAGVLVPSEAERAKGVRAVRIEAVIPK